MVWIALTVMIVAGLAHHLGLPQAIASVVAKVARCPKCLTFWATFIVLLIVGSGLLFAVMLSVLTAYLSHYWGLVMMLLNDLYNKLWERVNKNE
jgi:O-antigen/teichoic acid export membrane protein